ncbi:MAG: hypothetical protein O3A85_09150 [Proteobacteria bacterium]|nr:hypothetical protein [Pseudomonadota bacterium]
MNTQNVHLNSEASLTATPTNKSPESADMDWELMFDGPGTGLVAAVESAPNVMVLGQILSVLINSLFNRDDDQHIKDTYLALAREAVPAEADGRAVDLEKSRQAVLLVLQHIKRQRVRLQPNTARKTDAALDPQQQAEEITNEPVTKTAEEEQAAPTDSSNKAENIFIDFMSRTLRRRINILALPLIDSYTFKGQLAFLLSPDFADHFEKILRADILPSMVPMVHRYVLQIENKPESERQQFLETLTESRQDRNAISDAWQRVWKDLTEAKPSPNKPAAVAGGGMLNRLVKKVKNKPSGPGEMTLEQWQKKTAEIKKSNARAVENWGKITQNSGKYLPPEDQDKKLLMDLFASTENDIQDQMRALHQIASQGGSAKAFDTYTQGRDIDLALLSLCYRNPDIFLKRNAEAGQRKSGDGNTPSFLKYVLSGYKANARKSQFPLVSRYAYPIAE